MEEEHRKLPFQWEQGLKNWHGEQPGVVPVVQGAAVSPFDTRGIVQGAAAPSFSPGISPRLGRNDRVEPPRVPPRIVGPGGRMRERGLCGSTKFEQPQSFPVEAMLPTSIAMGDFNQDKKADLVVAASGSDVVVVFLGRGDGSFARGVRYPVGPPGSRPTHVRLADMNGDGRLDILTSNMGGNTLSVLLGRGDGTFLYGQPYSLGRSSAPNHMAVGDFNGDGVPDAVTAHAGSRTLNILFGNGAGGFGRSTTIKLGHCKDKTAAVSAVSAKDLNCDCHDDIIVGLPGELAIFHSLGAGTFRPSVSYPLPSGGAPTYIAYGYLNHDVHVDLVTADGPLFDTVTVLLGRGDTRFSRARSFSVAPGRAPVALALADVNGDLKTDIITANAVSNDVTVLTGGGDGTFSVARTFPVDGASGRGWGPVAVTAGLVDDSDCKVDIAVVHMASASVSVLLNACPIIK